MIRNHIRAAFRNLLANKGYSVINIAGLAVGLTVTLLLGLWIADELAYNRNFKDRAKIAIVMQNKLGGQQIQTAPWTPYPLAEALRAEHGDAFEEVALSSGPWEQRIDWHNNIYYFNGTYVEKSFCRLIGLELKSGSADVLDDPNSILLSSRMAKALFGKGDPINKTIQINKDWIVKVAGIYQDLPQNASFGDLAFIGSWQLYFQHNPWIKEAPDPWRPNSFFTYVRLNKNIAVDEASRLIRDVRLRHVNEQLAKQKPQLFLHPMDKWHLYDAFENGINTGGSIQYVWMFGIIGAFVLLVACINFINLSTARSEKRAKEVGIRKTIGSSHQQLVYQFFIESSLYVIVAFVFSLFLTYLSLPLFNWLADKSMALPLSNPIFWISCLFFCLLTTAISGLYPSFYLSSFRPITVLKGHLQLKRSAFTPRKVLLVFQFTTSIVLIIGTMVVFRQIEFTKNRPIGYSRDGLVSMPTNSQIHSHLDVIARELTSSGLFLAACESDAPPTGINSTSTGFDWEGKNPQVPAEFPVTAVSYDYGRTVGWEVSAGRDFSRDFSTDSSAVIINEAAARFIGFDQPIGKRITWDGKPRQIVGVVRNLLMESPYAEVRPSVFFLLQGTGNTLVAKINPEVAAGTAIAKLEELHKRYSDEPFHYAFADEEYAAKFRGEERVGKLAGVFAGLAVFISCLGLFGLAAFSAQQRMKELGIRKVLGASVSGIIGLLCKDFMKLVLVAIVIASPIAWWTMHNWLEDFAYRINVEWWMFIVAGVMTALIALFTVSWQAIRAAVANPVDSLRNE